MYAQFKPSLVHSLKYVMGGILGFDCQEMKLFFLLSSKQMFSSCFVHNMKGVISTQTSVHAKHFGICPIIACLMLLSLCSTLFKAIVARTIIGITPIFGFLCCCFFVLYLPSQ